MKSPSLDHTRIRRLSEKLRELLRVYDARPKYLRELFADLRAEGENLFGDAGGCK